MNFETHVVACQIRTVAHLQLVQKDSKIVLKMARINSETILEGGRSTHMNVLETKGE